MHRRVACTAWRTKQKKTQSSVVSTLARELEPNRATLGSLPASALVHTWASNNEVYVRRYEASGWREFSASARGGGVSNSASLPRNPAFALDADKVCVAGSEYASEGEWAMVRCHDLGRWRRQSHSVAAPHAAARLGELGPIGKPAYLELLGLFDPTSSGHMSCVFRGSVRGFLVSLSLFLGACTGDIGTPSSGDGSDGSNGSDGSATTDGSNASGDSSGTTTGSTGTTGNTGTTGATGSGGAGSFVASESEARRLSRAELDNTLETLIGDDTSPARQILSEDEHSPYDNDYTLQLASSALVNSLELLATDVATRAKDNNAFKDALPCVPSDNTDAECFRAIAEYLLTRGFRRVISDEEVDPYMALLDFASEQVPGRDIDFYTAVELLIRSIVQDPEFLYRIEVGTPTQTPGVVQLDDYEVATRMSYLLWGDMPDDELFAQASSGALLDAAARRTSAERMFESSRAREQLERFHAMWLGYRAIPQSAELAAAFARETNALIDRVLFDEPQDYLNLFTMPETYVDDMLAKHYGLPAPGGEGWVSYGDTGRLGILSHGSVLSSFSKFSDTSPTQRGILVRTRLMCDVVLPPPPTVNTDEPPSAMDANCKVERYQQHRSSAACASCHGQLDPIGFGLENYDMAGRWRDHDDADESCLIDGMGTVEPYGDFSGPGELAQILVDEGEIDDCVVKQYLSFAVGRALDPTEDELAQGLVADFRGGDHLLTSVLVDYVASDAFTLKLSPPEP